MTLSTFLLRAAHPARIALALAAVFLAALTWAGNERAPRAAQAADPPPAERPPDATSTASPAGFISARRNYPWSFPRDTGSHPAYQTEWWYYTGHLDGSNGERFGYELTFFRSGLQYPPLDRPSAWAANDLYFAHFAVTDITGRRFTSDERAARGALGLAGASTAKQDVFLKNWHARLEGNVHRLFAEGEGWRIDLRAEPVKPPALHGIDGYSQKGTGEQHASQYYSYTRMRTAGTVKNAGRAVPVTGESWMDHEFSTNSLAPDEVGWDWFSFHLANGEDLMLYRMRRRDGTADPYSGGTWVGRAGETTRLQLADYSIEELSRWTSPKTKITYPAKWRIRIPSRGLQVTVTPVLAEQELTTEKSTGVTYWEGAVEITGTLRGSPIRGRGYVELTGYGGSLAGRA